MIFFRKFKQICIGKVPERNYFHTIPTKGVEISRDRREKLAIAHEKNLSKQLWAWNRENTNQLYDQLKIRDRLCEVGLLLLLIIIIILIINVIVKVFIFIYCELFWYLPVTLLNWISYSEFLLQDILSFLASWFRCKIRLDHIKYPVSTSFILLNRAACES